MTDITAAILLVIVAIVATAHPRYPSTEGFKLFLPFAFITIGVVVMLGPLSVLGELLNANPGASITGAILLGSGVIVAVLLFGRRT